MIEDISPVPSPIVAQTAFPTAWPPASLARLPPSTSMPSIDATISPPSTSFSHKRPLSISHQTYSLENSKKTRFSSGDPFLSSPSTAHVQTKHSAQEQAWHHNDNITVPTMHPDVMPRARVHQLLALNIRSLLIIDVRDGHDYAAASIRASLNILAAGFVWNRGVLHELASKACMEWVVFTDSSGGSSSSDNTDGQDIRAWRCAGWFLEWTRQVAGDAAMQVSVLEGGIAGWIGAGLPYVRFMDGHEIAQARQMMNENAGDDKSRVDAVNVQATPWSADGMEL